jgi:chromosome partitioning protein
MQPNPDILVGLSEAAELLSVSKQQIANWRSRNPSFPAPVAELRSGPVWRASEVAAWGHSEGLQIRSLPANGPGESRHRESAIVVAAVNMKGGVGKSTLTANLGWHVALARDQRVLLVDLDPQFNLSQYILGVKQYSALVKHQSPTVVDVFEHPERLDNFQSPKTSSRAIVRYKEWETGGCLHLLPSALSLVDALKNPDKKKKRLTHFINSVRTEYDLVLIDCPPTDSMLTEAAYLTSNYLVIPAKPEFLSSIGIPLLSKSLRDFKNDNPLHQLDVSGIVLNGIHPSSGQDTTSRDEILREANRLGWYVFTSELSYSDSYPRGSREGRPIFDTGYARSGKKWEMFNLAEEFCTRIKL